MQPAQEMTRRRRRYDSLRSNNRSCSR